MDVKILRAQRNYTVNLLKENESWFDREYREAYLEGFLEQNIALQVQINRKRRSLSQKDLAVKMNTTQSAIARLENPGYGKYSLSMLTKLAQAFDCALSVKFISYAELAHNKKMLSEQSMYAETFDELCNRIRIHK